MGVDVVSMAVVLLFLSAMVSFIGEYRRQDKLLRVAQPEPEDAEEAEHRTRLAEFDYKLARAEYESRQKKEM